MVIEPLGSSPSIAAIAPEQRSLTLPLEPEAAVLALLDALTVQQAAPDGVIVNDWDTFTLLQAQGTTVLRGTELDMRHAPAGSLQSPCVRDMLESGVPEGMQGAGCIVRYPLAQVCRSVCPHSTQAEGSCDTAVCLNCMGRPVHSTPHALPGLTLRGDALMHRLSPSDPLYLSVVTSRVTLLYTPDGEWMEETPQ